MPRRATQPRGDSRSSQNVQTKSQQANLRRRRVVDEDVEEEDEDQEEGDQEEEDDPMEGDDDEDAGAVDAGAVDDDDMYNPRGDVGDEISRRASDLVRLALFTEQKRVVLRREDIVKKVLGVNRRAFLLVFDQAQKILNKTFGMELVELKTRAQEDNNTDGPENINDDTVLEDVRNATGVKKKVAAIGSKTYMLRSTLHPLIIEHAALSDEAIFAEEALDVPDDDDVDFGRRSYGSIIAWSSADQLAVLGILHITLVLILVSGRVMSDGDLRSFLRRMRLQPNTHVPSSCQSTQKATTLDMFLSSLVRQGFVERRVVGDPKAKKGGVGAKRVRSTQGEVEEPGTMWEWRWGPRAHSEIGEKNIANFVGEFMVESEMRTGDGEREGDGEEELQGRGGQRRRKKKEEESAKRLELLLKGITRAAGGPLSDAS